MNLSKLKLNHYSTIIGSSLFIMITANLTFFKLASDLYPIAENFSFMIALSVLVFALLVLLMAIIGLIVPVRLLSAAFIVIAALSAYFADTFGTVIDTEMIRNTLETNVSEAVDLASLTLVLRVLLLAALPIGILYWLNFSKETRIQKIARSGILIVSAFGLSVICILSNGSQFASFFREHKSVRYYITPSYPIYSAGRYVSDIFKHPESKELISLNANVNKEATLENSKPNLVIMVLGETARSENFSLNGYKRDTNEFTRNEKNLISYTNISSCGTSTAVSVPCIFSYKGRDGFNVKRSKQTQNILDLLQSSGVSVLWRDNNTGSKGMADRVPYQNFGSPEINTVCDIECRDIGMLGGLQEYILKQKGDVLIVMHQMGNHGPAYFKRYPKSFSHFTPACESAEFSECTQQEIINAYDNSIRYTDYFLSKVIAFLKTNTAYNTSMLYVSDHGESLGEAGLYLHGLPYSFAPDTQTKVPLLLWAGDTSPINIAASNQIKNKENSHDSIFDSLLTLFNVTTSLPLTNNSPLFIIDKKVYHEVGSR
jgi:lipid A ethanolaminephosphotransferase